MKHIRPFSLYESNDPDSLIRVANQFISDLSKVYDLRFGKPFDKDKSKLCLVYYSIFNWAKSEGLDVKVAYFDSDVEAHIAPVLNGKVIDFAVKQFTGNPNDNYLILNPEDYRNYGYQTFEIYDELPELETVFCSRQTKMKHIRPFSLYESDDLDSIIRDLRGIGMQDFIWDVRYKNGYKLDEEAEKDYVASWRSNSGAKVVKITGTMDYGVLAVHRNFLAQLIITLSNEKEYSARLSTGSHDGQNYANLRISYPSGYGPLEEKEFSMEEGYKIWKGEKLIMKEILPLIDKYPIK